MYLSLTVLPKGVRDAMGLGYLFCRAADTIADTRLIPIAERAKRLEEFRAAFAGGDADVSAPTAAGLAVHQAHEGERELMRRLGECVSLWQRFPEEERALLRRVVVGVTDGMRMDLELFPAETEDGLRALKTPEELDRYCAYIGGEPGLFWTDLCLLRIPGLKDADRDLLRNWGLSLGKGLQMTNILRDIPQDLRIGRCYLPGPELKKAGLEPEDLLAPAALEKLKPVLSKWTQWALANLEAGAEYVSAMPGMRLKAAAAWPLLLSFKTLIRVNRSADLLRPDRTIKVPRRHVYRLILGSAWTLSSNARFRKKFEALRSELSSALQPV